MPTSFEMLNHSVVEEMAKSYEAEYELVIERKRNELRDLGVEVPLELAAWGRDLQAKYLKEWKDLGGEGEPVVPVHYIPEHKRVDVAKLFKKSSLGDTRGMYHPETGAVIVFVGEGAFAWQAAAKTTAHELAHAFSGADIRYEIVDGKREVKSARFGALLSVPGKKYISLLEECYAVDRELEAEHERYERLPPDNLLVQNRKRKEDLIQGALGLAQIDEEDVPYAYILGDEEVVSSNYVPGHKVGLRVLDETPNGRRLFMEARVTKNWVPFARAVNDHFGPETYRVVGQIDPTDKVGCEMLGDFLDIPKGDIENRRRFMEFL